MASLVGVFAASHGPMIAREWDNLSPKTRAHVEAGFGSVSTRLMASPLSTRRGDTARRFSLIAQAKAIIVITPKADCRFCMSAESPVPRP